MIRTATLTDARSIARIQIDAWQAAYQGIVPAAYLAEMDLEQRTERWNRILSESLSETHVFESEGKVTAWISYGPSRDEDFEGYGEIWALYVAPNEWRCGQGRELIHFVEEIARNSGTTDLTLWVLEGNLQGRAFYEKSGFSADGTSKQFLLENFALEEIRYHKKVRPTPPA